MADEPGVIERDVTIQLQKICDHISRTEVRSFLMLANFPITFGSLTPVSSEITSSQVHEEKLTSLLSNTLIDYRLDRYRQSASARFILEDPLKQEIVKSREKCPVGQSC